MPDVNIEIRQIKPGDKFTGLSVGDQAFVPLKIFFERKARKFHDGYLARTYLAIADGKVVGYLTLVCSQITTEAPLVEDDFEYRDYPAIKIARLLIDRRFRGNSLGSALIQLAIGTAINFIAPNVGCRFVVVDSKQESLGFYKKQGFTLLDTEANKAHENPLLFIDLKKL